MAAIHRNDAILGGSTKDGPSSRPGSPEEEARTNCPVSVGQFRRFPVASFPSEAEGGPNRKGMRPLLGCWPAEGGSHGAGREGWPCRGVAAHRGALEPRHPELPGAGALQPIQPDRALPPAVQP